MRTKYRIIGDVIIVLLMFIAPWWLSLALIGIGIFLFHDFYEGLVFAMLLDGFHGIPGISFFGSNTFFITTVGLIFVLSIFLKTRLKFYS